MGPSKRLQKLINFRKQYSLTREPNIPPRIIRKQNEAGNYTRGRPIVIKENYVTLKCRKPTSTRIVDKSKMDNSQDCIVTSSQHEEPENEMDGRDVVTVDDVKSKDLVNVSIYNVLPIPSSIQVNTNDKELTEVLPVCPNSPPDSKSSPPSQSLHSLESHQSMESSVSANESEDMEAQEEEDSDEEPYVNSMRSDEIDDHE